MTKNIIKDSPDYEATFAKWVDIMESEVFVKTIPLGVKIEELVKKALESGNSRDLLPEYIGRNEREFIDF